VSKRANRSTDEKLRTVLGVLRGDVTLAEAGRRAGVSDMTVAKSRDRFVEGGTVTCRVTRCPSRSWRGGTKGKILFRGRRFGGNGRDPRIWASLLRGTDWHALGAALRRAQR